MHFFSASVFRLMLTETLVEHYELDVSTHPIFMTVFEFERAWDHGLGANELSYQATFYDPGHFNFEE